MYKALDCGALGIQAAAREAIEYAAKYGFEGVTLNPNAILEAGADRVSDWLAEYGLYNAGFGVGTKYLAQGEEYERELISLRRQAKAARDAGATRALTYIMPSNNERDFDAQYDFLAQRLRPVRDILWEQGIAFALEFIGTQAAYASGKYPFIHNLPEMLRLCDTLECTVLIDAHHMHTAGHGAQDVLPLRANQIGYVHINDAMPGYTPQTLPDSPRLLPGESGVIDNAKLLENLMRIGYEGPVVTEPFYQPFKEMEPDAILQATAQAVASVWPKCRG